MGRSYATQGNYYGTRKSESGITNLVFATSRGFYTLNGDGKGNFDGLPAVLMSDAVATADTNGDGLTDLVASDDNNSYRVSAVGRGDATFPVLVGLTYQFQGF